jgi:hypothetical protein
MLAAAELAHHADLLLSYGTMLRGKTGMSVVLDENQLDCNNTRHFQYTIKLAVPHGQWVIIDSCCRCS